jgi:hypothetical protein
VIKSTYIATAGYVCGGSAEGKIDIFQVSKDGKSGTFCEAVTPSQRMNDGALLQAAGPIPGHPGHCVSYLSL